MEECVVLGSETGSNKFSTQNLAFLFIDFQEMIEGRGGLKISSLAWTKFLLICFPSVSFNGISVVIDTLMASYSSILSKVLASYDLL